MSYKFFDKQFLVTPDDKDIIGKKVFYNDNLTDLISDVERGDFRIANILSNIFDVDDDDAEANCFKVNNARWGLAYYDPSYEAKVAYRQGKKIQYKEAGGEWADVVMPSWYVCHEYRVKPEQENTPKTRRMTNKELSRWLADGNGERVDLATKYVTTYIIYHAGNEDKECDGEIRIREWDSNEWHEPLVEVKE